ncbi:MAG: ParB/RepB/Spo0J family partition protein [Actinobacteria bacterium]|nr:ParB/RepB/Spo0J family partition protein [Actinomycetota bacterium]
MVRRSGLGRGLGALIPDAAVTEAAEGEELVLRDIPVGQIGPNPHQPRKAFDEEALGSLTASVRELGVLQPILVRQAGVERYEIVAGERRWRAAKRAGLPTVPALVRAVDDDTALEHALVENLHREDLNPMEEAAAYQQLLEDFGFTHDDLARRVGRSRSAVSNTLRLFQLPPTIQRMVAEGRLSAGHARALLATPDRAYQEALARRAVVEDLSVRQVEEAVRARSADASSSEEASAAVPPGREPALRAPGLLELEEVLSDRLETRVKVMMGAKRGRVTIEFAGLEDLERIYRAMTGASTPRR